MCNTTTMIPEVAEADLTPEQGAFAGRMYETLNQASAGLMISVGHRTGLFDALQDGEAVTSQELAAKAGLNERYVREWLGAMATSRIITIDPVTDRYALPADHAAFLGSTAAAGNMASFFQFIAVMGAVESRIVDCFKNGGGVSYEEFDRLRGHG